MYRLLLSDFTNTLFYFSFFRFLFSCSLYITSNFHCFWLLFSFLYIILSVFLYLFHSSIILSMSCVIYGFLVSTTNFSTSLDIHLILSYSLAASAPLLSSSPTVCKIIPLFPFCPHPVGNQVLQIPCWSLPYRSVDVLRMSTDNML